MRKLMYILKRKFTSRAENRPAALRRPHRSGKAGGSGKASGSGKAGSKDKYKIEYDNLAMPEVHTGEVASEAPKQPSHDKINEFQAIPEYHSRHRRK